MGSINLPELSARFAGTRFSELVQHHLEGSQQERILALHQTTILLSEVARGVAEGSIDRWNARAYDRDFWRREPAEVAQRVVNEFIERWNAQVYVSGFWQRDTSEVFDDIVADARTALRPLGLETDDDAAFNLFNIIVMNYAFKAYNEPNLREFMGISRGSFPWPSAVGLLSPIVATTFLAIATPAGAALLVGYFISQLGYLLFAAGVFGGTFRILGLKNRWQVIGAAVVSLLIGTVIVNVGD